MVVNAVDVSWTKRMRFLGAVVATLIAIPGGTKAQAQRGEWLQVTPANPRAPITAASWEGESGRATAAAVRTAPYRSRADSLAGYRALEASKKDERLRIVVSLDDRKLWVVTGRDTVLEAPVAIGSGERLVFGEKAWQFHTPRGVRAVKGKQDDPLWTPPEWHYAETAKEYGLKVAYLSLGKAHKISGGRKIMFKDGEAGVLHPDSGFMYLPLDEEIVFDNTLFVPPVGSKNRQIDGTLGMYKLDTGNGILLHGTPHKNSIGRAATHGCLRLRDEDIEWLYDYIPIGTKVYIY
jgi:lipoprotein-anchoring transpeptidase ErfK/SrfK